MNNNTLQLVTFEQAKRLKEIGFEWPVNHYYSVPNGILYQTELFAQCNAASWWLSAPTIQLALKFFREVKGIFASVSFGYLTTDGDVFLSSSIHDLNGQVDFNKRQDYIKPDEYDEAESALLSHLLEIAG
jgi:hypothetical protein